MIRRTIPTTLFVDGTKHNTVPGLSKTVSQETNWTLHSRKIRENGQNGYMWSYRSLCDLLWYTITQLQRFMGHKHHQRLYSRPWLSRFLQVSDILQSGTCNSTVYPFYAHITVRACTYMFMLEFQLVIPYHNRHTHCPRLSPSVMSNLEMLYIQHGTVRDSHMWQVWDIKSGWSSRGVIGLHADAIWLASNAYMVRYMSRTVT